jgi:hypothetical protein
MTERYKHKWVAANHASHTRPCGQQLYLSALDQHQHTDLSVCPTVHQYELHVRRDIAEFPHLTQWETQQSGQLLIGDTDPNQAWNQLNQTTTLQYRLQLDTATHNSRSIHHGNRNHNWGRLRIGIKTRNPLSYTTIHHTVCRSSNTNFTQRLEGKPSNRTSGVYAHPSSMQSISARAIEQWIRGQRQHSNSL